MKERAEVNFVSHTEIQDHSTSREWTGAEFQNTTTPVIHTSTTWHLHFLFPQLSGTVMVSQLNKILGTPEGGFLMVILLNLLELTMALFSYY